MRCRKEEGEVRATMFRLKRFAVESEGRANHSSLVEDANRFEASNQGLSNGPYDWCGLLKLLKEYLCVYESLSGFVATSPASCDYVPCCPEVIANYAEVEESH